MFLDNKRVQMDDLLDKMAQELQLDKTRFERMINHYEAVKKWIEEDELFFKPYKYDVYPHGSVRIKTTVKPIGKDEFDLDIAVHLKSDMASHTPEKIYMELKRRLSENKTYEEMLKLKKRCLRLNYTGDFHMDIMPGVQEDVNDEDKILVPDRKLGTWVSSNPKGYATWFMKKVESVRVSLLEKAMQAENIPHDDFSDKKPLQRAVQLIKRYRDIYFQKDDSYKTSSIILTTIAGQLYDGEDSIYDAIDNIIIKIRENIDSLPGRIKVINPVNPEEDFTDKWDEEPEYYTAFKNFCNHLYFEWQKIKKDQGIIEESSTLKELFGKELFLKAQNKQTELVEDLRRSQSLRADKRSGVLTTASIASTKIKSNTFFGH